MKRCEYCDETFDKEKDLSAHLAGEHDFEELSSIDRRRVEQYRANNNLTDSVPVIGGRMSRRKAMALAGGTGVGAVGITAFGVRRWMGSASGEVLQEDPDRIETRQRGTDSDIINGDESADDDIKHRVVVVSDSHWERVIESIS